MFSKLNSITPFSMFIKMRDLFHLYSPVSLKCRCLPSESEIYFCYVTCCISCSNITWIKYTSVVCFSNMGIPYASQENISHEMTVSVLTDSVNYM